MRCPDDNAQGREAADNCAGVAGQLGGEEREGRERREALNGGREGKWEGMVPIGPQESTLWNAVSDSRRQ